MGVTLAVSTAFHQLSADMARQGVKINAAKCELWGPGASYCTNLTDVKVMAWDARHGITILGVPINYPGSSAQGTAAWTMATEKLHATLERVTSLTDAQTAHHLLRKCLDGCKVNHLLRASDCYTCERQIQACDTAIAAAFEDIFAHGLSTNQRAQAALPLSVGGCGIRMPSVIRPAARVSALATFYTRGRHAVGVPDQGMGVNSTWMSPVLTELTSLFGGNCDPLPIWTGQHDRLKAAEPQHMQQKWWSQHLGRRTMTRLLDSASPRDQAKDAGTG